MKYLLVNIITINNKKSFTRKIDIGVDKYNIVYQMLLVDMSIDLSF